MVKCTRKTKKIKIKKYLTVLKKGRVQFLLFAIGIIEGTVGDGEKLFLSVGTFPVPNRNTSTHLLVDNKTIWTNLKI